MNRHRAALIAFLAASTAASATNTCPMPFTCPVCNTKFESEVVMSKSTAGADDEGRPISMGYDFHRFRIHTCPKCRYTAFGYSFPPSKHAPAGKDIEAIRKALPGRVDGNKPTDLDRAALCVHCYRARVSCPYEVYRACLLAAWLSDDANRPALARRYRKEALAAIGPAVAAGRFPNLGRKWETHYLRGVLTARLGDDGEAVRLLHAMLAEMDPVLTDAWDRLRELEKKQEHLDPNAPIQNWNAASEAQALALFLSDLQESAYWQEAGARQRLLGPLRGRAAALGGHHFDRLAYMDLHADGRDPNSVAALLVFLADEKASWKLRARAAAFLAHPDPAGDRAIPGLIQALADDNAGVRGMAATVLGRIGPAARPAIPALRRATKDKVDYVREYAAQALKQIRGKPEKE